MNTEQPYEHILAQIGALLAGQSNLLANAANVAAVLYGEMTEVNWAGFYFRDGDHLVLGPFQGKPACTQIPLGRGVCGTAAARRETLVVPDVRCFPGHIACDPQSRSEIVVPLLHGGRVIGVLDLDSPQPGRFTQVDRDGLEAVVALLLGASDAETLSRLLPNGNVRSGECQ